MILVWNDVKSFNQHLENMRRFRELHQSVEKCGWNIIKDMPVTRDIQVRLRVGGARCSFDITPPAMVVPLWKITLPRSSQN
jgi:hypothetical protein